MSLPNLMSHTCCRAFGSGAVIACFTTQVCRDWESKPNLPHARQTLFLYATATMSWMGLISLKALISYWSKWSRWNFSLTSFTWSAATLRSLGDGEPGVREKVILIMNKWQPSPLHCVFHNVFPMFKIIIETTAKNTVFAVRIVLKVFSLIPVIICFWGQRFRKWKRLKLSPPPGATKWYPYSPNRGAVNDSPMCPLHCPGVRLMQNSKIREIISDL